jgi:PAS domain S-box-containing protein
MDSLIKFYDFIRGVDVETLTKLFFLWSAVLVPTFTFVYWSFIKPLKKKINIINGMEQWQGDVAKAHLEMTTLLKSVVKEVTPNGGNSLRDKVDGIGKDVSILKIDAVQLKIDAEAQKQRLRILLRPSLNAMFETDQNGRFVWANDAYLNLCGLPVDKVYGNGWLNGIDIHDRDEVLEEIKCCIDQDRDFDMEYRMIHVSGRAILVRASAQVIKDTSNNVVTGITGTVQSADRANQSRPATRKASGSGPAEPFGPDLSLQRLDSETKSAEHPEC